LERINIISNIIFFRQGRFPATPNYPDYDTINDFC
jgi:hypothetical protein